tara:strand:- start:212 stop:433 length:222 start_codon:yes stop_codon:yes gene_type:complete
MPIWAWMGMVSQQQQLACHNIWSLTTPNPAALESRVQRARRTTVNEATARRKTQREEEEEVDGMRPPSPLNTL